MTNQIATEPQQADSPASQLASHHHILPHHIAPFFDFTDAVTYFCTTCMPQHASFWSVGHLFPDLEIAIDRAGIRPIELLGVSPFSGDMAVLADQQIRPTDSIWVSNPNRITGAHFSVSELERMAQMVPEGFLIVDESYPTFFGISAAPLLRQYPNILLIQPVGHSTYSAGFMATTNLHALEQLHSGERKLMPTAHQNTMQSLIADFDPSERVELVHDESLRLALKLNRLGVRSWITATDFLLVRFADVATAGNHLAAHNVHIENLSGYPQLSGYMRYRIQSHTINDRFLDAVSRMPEAIRTTRRLEMTKQITVPSNRVAHLLDESSEQTTRESIFVTESVDAHE